MTQRHLIQPSVFKLSFFLSFNFRNPKKKERKKEPLVRARGRNSLKKRKILPAQEWRNHTLVGNELWMCSKKCFTQMELDAKL